MPPALPFFLIFSSKSDYFPSHFLMLVYLPLIFGQMHNFLTPRAMLVPHLGTTEERDANKLAFTIITLHHVENSQRLLIWIQLHSAPLWLTNIMQ